MGRPKAPCGTDSAYRRHLRNGEDIDDACRRAHTEAGRKSARRQPAPRDDAPGRGAESNVGRGADTDDMTLIVDTLRAAFKKVAKEDPTRLAPLAREFRTAVEATRGPVETPKELTLAEQLAEARAARAARTQSEGAAS